MLVSSALISAPRFALAQGDAPEEQEQPESEASENEARLEFEAGTRAANEERWLDAYRHFERAYDRSGRPVALYNVAIALRSMGRFVESRDAFARLRAEHSDFQVDTEPLLHEVEESIATVTLIGLAEDAYASVNGRRQEGSRFELDPGPIAIRVERPGYQAWRWQGELEPGESQRLEIEMSRELELEEEPVEVVEPGANGLAIALAISGTLILGGGVALGIITSNRRADIEVQYDCLEDGCDPGFEDDLAAARRTATASTALIAVGGAALGTAFLAWLLDWGQPSQESASLALPVRVHASPFGGGLDLQLQF